MAKLLYQDLSYQIMAAVFEVYNTLGYGFLEKVYERALLRELKERNIPVEAQKELNVFYKGDCVGRYYADLIVREEVLLELKSVENLNKIYQAQVLNYLKASGLKLGLLVNFGKEKVDCKRLIL